MLTERPDPALLLPENQHPLEGFVYPGRGMSACLQFTKQSTVNHNLTAITPVHLDLEIIFS